MLHYALVASSFFVFMPHGICCEGDLSVLWLKVLFDGKICLSYWIIPFILIDFIRRRRDLRFNWIFIMFGAFILGCGTTPLIQVWTVWRPNYFCSGGTKQWMSYRSDAIDSKDLLYVCK